MKLAGFRSMLGGSATEQLQGYVKELKHIYDENVVPFENTDDQYNASLGIRYNEWCILCQVFRENLTCSIGPIAGGNWTDVQGLGDYFRDIGYTIENFCCGVGNAVKDFVMGNARLAGGIVKLLGYAGYSLWEMFWSRSGRACLIRQMRRGLRILPDMWQRML